MICFLIYCFAGAGSRAVIFKVRRKELAGREFDMLKYLAGIVGSGYALLAGNAEIVCGNKHLYPAFKLHYCEKPEGYKHFSVAGSDEVTFKKAGNACGKSQLAAFAAIAAVIIRDAAVKYNGRNNLNYGARSIRCLSG